MKSRKNRILLLLCFLAYTISYVGKYSYSTNIQNVINDFQISKAQAGYATSAFFFCYGGGQLINGILCERINSKWAITFSLICSATITCAMFFLKNILLISILWGVNGLVLSALWCHCIKLLASIREKDYMAKSTTVMSLTVPVGLVCAYGCSALFTYLKIWKLTYLFSAILLVGIGGVFFVCIGKMQDKETPKEEEVVVGKDEQEGGNIFQVFGLLVVPLLFLCIGTGLLRDGSSTWLPVLLSDTYSLPDYFSILLTLGLPLMGVFTAMISTRLIKITKTVFGVCLIAGLISVVVMAILVFAFRSSVILLIALFMALSLAGYVLANTLTSILPLYYKKQLKSGQTAGITNACVYLGSTISTLFLGSVVDNFSWTVFMIVLLVVALIITVMAFIGTIIKKENREK